MIKHEINTANLTLESKAQIWKQGIRETYYDLLVNIPSLETFAGNLNALAVDGLELSYLQSKPVQYICEGKHHNQEQDSFLLALPVYNKIQYTHREQETVVHPGSFLLQHGFIPYTFNCPDKVSMWVIKIMGKELRNFCHQPEILCVNSTIRSKSNKNRQVGFLMSYIPIIFEELKNNKNNSKHSNLIKKHLIELIALLLNSHQSVINSKEKVIIQSNLERIKRYSLQNLSKTDLTAETVATACRISRRYLHMLFQDQELSFNQWVKEQRLTRAYELLTTGHYPFSITYLANQCGFKSAAYFSTQFKKRFKINPRELL